jgi:hypothetical protein
MNRHTDTGKFMPGESTGVYRGKRKHGRAVEAQKDALFTKPSRTPVVAHNDCPSVGTLADVSAKGATTFGGPKSNG